MRKIVTNEPGKQIGEMTLRGEVKSLSLNNNNMTLKIVSNQENETLLSLPAFMGKKLVIKLYEEQGELFDEGDVV